MSLTLATVAKYRYDGGGANVVLIYDATKTVTQLLLFSAPGQCAAPVPSGGTAMDLQTPAEAAATITTLSLVVPQRFARELAALTA